MILSVSCTSKIPKNFNKHIKHTAHKANFQPQHHNCTALAVQGIRFIADYVYFTDFTQVADQASTNEAMEEVLSIKGPRYGSGAVRSL